MKILNLILISMICLNIQSSLAAPSVKETSPFETIQLEKMIVLADLSANEIKKLKETGEIMSLESILQQVQKDYPGRVIEVELDEDDKAYVYEIELVDKDNIVWELEIDATTGKVIKHEQDD